MRGVPIFDVDAQRIVCDLDGTLVNTLEVVQRRLWQMYQVWMPPDVITEYSVEDCAAPYVARQVCLREYGPESEGNWPIIDVELRCREAIRSMWMDPSLYHEARPYYRLWHPLVRWTQVGGALAFVTARPECAEAVTRDWLADYGLAQCPVQFEENKARALSEHVVRGGKQVAFLDDCKDQCVDVAQQYPQVEVLSIVVHQPWTKEGPVFDCKRMRRTFISTALNGAVARAING